MKKSEIVDLIAKNIEILKEEEINDLIYHNSGDYSFFMDQLGIDKYPKYDYIEEKYKLLNNEKCDCKILAHHYDDEYDDPFGINKYPYEDECLLCHKKYYNPEGHTIRFNPNKINSIDKKSYSYIKYSLYKAILNYIDKYDDNDEIDLYKEFDEIKKTIKSGLLYYKDNRTKDDYNVLVVTGSNEIKINNHILKGRTLSKTNEIVDDLKEIPFINIDVLQNKSSDDRFNDRCFKKFVYNNLDELKKIIKELNEKNYDMVIDISNLNNVIDGVVSDYDIKNIVTAEKYITIKDNYGLDEKEKERILSSSTDNKIVFLHDYDYDCSWNLSYDGHKYYYNIDGEVKSTTSNLLKRIIPEILTSDIPKSVVDKYEIKRLVR
jgi:hypothetical protein